MIKQLQAWNDSKTHVSIQFQNSVPLIIHPKCLSNVTLHHEIAHYSFENKIRVPIIASESGYLVWVKQNNPIVLEPSKNYQTCAFIVKSKTQAEQLIDDPTHIEERNEQQLQENQSITTQEENKIENIRFSQLAWGFTNKGRILKWNVKIGEFIQPQDVIGTYEDDDSDIKEFVTQIEGQVISLAQTKQNYSYNDVILQLYLINSHCKHIKIEDERCIYCRKNVILSNKKKDHNCYNEWNFDEDQMKKYSQEFVKNIIEVKKKLILVLDLDQTILHSIRVQKNFNIHEFVRDQRVRMQEELESNQNIDHRTDNVDELIKESIFEIECDEQSKFLVKLRPYFDQFFQNIIPYYEIFIYTKACRYYADEIIRQLKLINPQLNFPKIITRDDTEDVDRKSLHRLFADGVADNFIVILDDNQQIWNGYQDKLIYTKPFSYFRESQEIVQNPQIEDNNDHFLLTIGQKLVTAYWSFWKNVTSAQQLPEFFMESTNKLSKKCQKEFDKKQQTIRSQIINNSQDIYQLIMQRNISISQVYRDFKMQIFQGISLHFATSQKFEISKYIESVVKKKSLELGAQVKSKFENFYGIIITHSLLNIKSIREYQKESKPIVHYQWILDCETYMEKLDYSIYDLNYNTPENIENQVEFSKRLKNLRFTK